jgi:hypothetical protein
MIVDSSPHHKGPVCTRADPIVSQPQIDLHQVEAPISPQQDLGTA